MKTPGKMVIAIYWALTAGLLGAAVVLALLYAPTEETMGPVQKIFYLHLPSAINTFLAFMTVFIASIGYLVQRKSWWDDLASAAAKTGVFFCSIVLLTGMIWGKIAWGSWWTWSPRLTFSLLLWLLYVVYLLIRSSVDSEQRKGMVSAAYGIVAFLDVPLVYLSARMLPDIHPQSITLAPEMKMTLGFWFLPITLLNAGLIVTMYWVHAKRRANRNVTETEAPRAMNLELLGKGT